MAEADRSRQFNPSSLTQTSKQLTVQTTSSYLRLSMMKSGVSIRKTRFDCMTAMIQKKTKNPYQTPKIDVDGKATNRRANPSDRNNYTTLSVMRPQTWNKDTRAKESKNERGGENVVERGRVRRALRRVGTCKWGGKAGKAR